MEPHLEFGADLSSGGGAELGCGGSEGGETDDGEQTCIHLLGAGLPGQERGQLGLGGGAEWSESESERGTGLTLH